MEAVRATHTHTDTHTHTHTHSDHLLRPFPMLMLCRVFAILRSHTQSSLYRTVRQASPETLPLLFAAIATEAKEYGFTDDLVKLRTRKSQTAGLNSAIRTLKSKLEQVKPNSATCVCMCVVQTKPCSHE